MRYIWYLNATHGNKLIPSGLCIQCWWWSNLGKGFPIKQCHKQLLNAQSSANSELVGADNMSHMILWTDLHMNAQGCPIQEHIDFIGTTSP